MPGCDIYGFIPDGAFGTFACPSCATEWNVAGQDVGGWFVLCDIPYTTSQKPCQD